jgi:hypothetical protein
LRKYITSNVVLADGFQFLKGISKKERLLRHNSIKGCNRTYCQRKILELLKLIFEALKPGGKFIKTPDL